MAGAWLAAGMVVLGVITAIETERLKFGTPASDPLFMSVMFSDMIVFGGLVAAGIHLRKVPAARKRLVLISTLHLRNTRKTGSASR